MVFTTAVRASAGGRKIIMTLPGLSKSSLRKYPSLIPLHFFTVLGCAFASWYCYRLLSLKDVVLIKQRGLPYIKPSDCINLWNPNVDFKKQTKPENRPEL